MGRPKRADDGGLIYHVLNRANARMTIFDNDGDLEVFERVWEEAIERADKWLSAWPLERPGSWVELVNAA
jgi:putative transposase